VPELTHDCGKTVRFPSGMEGRKGRCPHCGGGLRVPDTGELPPQKKIQLAPPPHWEAYQAYLEDRGPAPRPLVMPKNLMLQAEADERWERQAQFVPSKFWCPVCKDRMSVDQILCTKCGLDFRTGHVIGKNQKVSAKGMAYLKDIPWLVEARKALKAEMRAEKNQQSAAKLKGKAPKRRRRR
jgi:hypothetical protein